MQIPCLDEVVTDLVVTNPSPIDAHLSLSLLPSSSSSSHQQQKKNDRAKAKPRNPVWSLGSRKCLVVPARGTNSIPLAAVCCEVMQFKGVLRVSVENGPDHDIHLAAEVGMHTCEVITIHAGNRINCK
eukprot:GHVU01130822.1.p1 GENE.GHVU01130822.1~~GHVU01130822.1.p1  ORF type:complete len:128 (-),score=16.65 GHVU01130822.1:362-745(-)